LPRDAMICDLFMYQNQNLYYTSQMKKLYDV